MIKRALMYCSPYDKDNDVVVFVNFDRLERNIEYAASGDFFRYEYFFYSNNSLVSTIRTPMKLVFSDKYIYSCSNNVTYNFRFK